VRAVAFGINLPGCRYAPLQNEMQESSCLNQRAPYVSERARRISRVDASKSHPDYPRIAESRQRARLHPANPREIGIPISRDGISSRKLFAPLRSLLPPLKKKFDKHSPLSCRNDAARRHKIRETGASIRNRGLDESRLEFRKSAPPPSLLPPPMLLQPSATDDE